MNRTTENEYLLKVLAAKAGLNRRLRSWRAFKNVESKQKM